MGEKKNRPPAKRFEAQLHLSEPVSARVQLKHVILAETVARRKPFQGGTQSALTLNVNVKTKPNRSERLIEVLPHFTLVAKSRVDADDEQLRIEALFVLQYEIDSFQGLQKSNIEAFGELNGLYNVWPYWREYVQATTVRMGLPALTIPVFRPLAVGQAPPKKPGARKASRKKRPAGQA
jgi:preprotein translocase subunit SecB